MIINNWIFARYESISDAAIELIEESMLTKKFVSSPKRATFTMPESLASSQANSKVLSRLYGKNKKLK